ncbi:MAG: hypothetical protein M5U34_32270 [Chloroflexi bacterium]|nr:hypothetical protein [Chloroflexota bacterium]
MLLFLPYCWRLAAQRQPPPPFPLLPPRQYRQKRPLSPNQPPCPLQRPPQRPPQRPSQNPPPATHPSPTRHRHRHPLPLADIINDEGGPVRLTGVVTYTNPFFTLGVAAPVIILEDQAGFVDRNQHFLMPVESQALAQITSDFFESPFFLQPGAAH